MEIKVGMAKLHSTITKTLFHAPQAAVDAVRLLDAPGGKIHARAPLALVRQTCGCNRLIEPAIW